MENSASPPVDCMVFGPPVKGGYAVAARFASLTLDRRPEDQDWLVNGEAEEERSANGATATKRIQSVKRCDGPVVESSLISIC